MPGGAVPGLPDPAWLGLAASEKEVAERGGEEGEAEANYRADQQPRGTIAKL